MEAWTDLPLETCRGPVKLLSAGLPGYLRQLSLWRAPARDGTLDPQAFRQALAWITRDAARTRLAEEQGERLHDALSSCRMAAVCHAMAVPADSLEPDRVLVLTPPSTALEGQAACRALFEAARQRFPDARLYSHSGVPGPLSGWPGNVGARHLSVTLDVGQLAVLFDRAMTDSSQFSIYLQCAGVDVTVLIPGALLPAGGTKANIRLHILFRSVGLGEASNDDIRARTSDMIAKLICEKLTKYNLFEDDEGLVVPAGRRAAAGSQGRLPRAAVLFGLGLTEDLRPVARAEPVEELMTGAGKSHRRHSRLLGFSGSSAIPGVGYVSPSGLD